jgi:tetratricopeptide (TPR) repeat protein
MNPTIRPTSLTANALLESLKIPGSGRSPKDSLRDVSVNPQIIQEFRPLVRSLEWELSDLYWSTQGVLPFARNDVPFVVNNDGRASENAAVVFFAYCLESSTGQNPIRVLELGAGTGLFARYFLDSFRTICVQENRDFYDRLVYFVSDRSERSLQQWEEGGVFAEHGAHAILGTCDGMRPSEFRNHAGETVKLEGLRALFANYVLDVLPSTVVRSGSTGPEQLCILTHLTNHRELLSQYSNLDFVQVRQLAVAENPAERAKLLPILSLLEFQTAFMSIDEDAPPYLDEALAFGRGLERILLNYGAIRCLEKCSEVLHPEGFVLLNDYGPVEFDQVASQASAQRFGASIALGINFPFLEHYFSRNGSVVLKPADDKRSIHARMICHKDLPRTREAFTTRFSSEFADYFDAPARDARQHAAAGRNNAALESFRLALQRSPRDWPLLGQAAEFVGLQLREFHAGLELIRTALQLNPWYSAWLWNALGDCLFCLERFADAHKAYLQAQRIDFDDVRTNFNLSYTYFQMGRFQESLEAISHGLAADVQGAYRERLLSKQEHVLAAISARGINERERLLKRASSFA